MTKLIYIFLTISLLTIADLYPQEIDDKPISSKKRISVSIGMGLSLLNTPSFNEYLKNEIPYKSKDSIKTFSLGLEFFAGAEYGISKNASIKLDYSYFVRSVRYFYSYFTYDFFYFIHQPSVFGYYLISGKHYQFKLGAGVSYQFTQLERTLSPNEELVYNSKGIGLRGEIVYAAQLSGRLSSYISGFAFANFSGSLKDANNIPLLSPTGKEVNLNAFGVGTRLGVSFYFN